MGEVKTINPFSMDNIDINELSKQQERIMMTDDVVVVLNGHLQHTRFLEKEKIYQIVEPRLVLGMDGQADICLNLQDYHLEKGCLLLLPSDTILEIKNVSDDARVVALVFREGINLTDEIVLNASPAEFSRILRMIYLTWDILQLKPYRRKTIQNLLQSIISDIQYIKDIADESEKHDQGTRTQDVFMQFKRLVHKYCFSERSIPFYASQLHVTPHHLSAIIRKASGQSVMYWVNRATIQEAKLLLKTNDAMGYEIADQLHFPSASAFSKFFKRETGMTPKMYQEDMK
ncbi:MAG: AraC family transcriptional regulator [Prevotella sp.]|jgi:transcriptional regulator, araC family|nr:AraC family transcriptional regulator [Prevotella sp.]